MDYLKGPWDVQNKGTLGRSARVEVVRGVNVDGSKNLPTVLKMPDLSERSYALAHGIAALPDLLEVVQRLVDMGTSGLTLSDFAAAERALAKAKRA